MASVNSDSGSTQARQLLAYALGDKRVNLGDLSSEEFDWLLRDAVNSVDLRELRGFKPLGKFLEFHSSSDISNVFGTNRLELAPEAALVQTGFEDEPVTFDTHVLSATRGMRRRLYTHKRYETGDETTDLKTADQWGKTCYLLKASMETLVLRRPRNHSYGDDNLATVRFSYQKVPNEDRYLINDVEVARLPVDNFRKYYGKNYAEEAVYLIWELRTICSRTQSELASQAESFGKRLAKLERLSEAVSH